MTEIHYDYRYNKRTFKKSKYRTYKPVKNYTRFDKKGNIIEEGEFGEKWRFSKVVHNPDSSVSYVSGHGYDYKKLNTVHYYQYDSLSKLIQDELWQFKDNKKSFLIYRTVYEYDSTGKLIRETEYDQENKQSRLKDYIITQQDELIEKDSVFQFTRDGIVRVEGKRQDTTITDSLGRPIERIHYHKDKFLNRIEYRYDKFGTLKTEIRYDDSPNNLWAITEYQYDIITKQLTRKFWKVVGDRTESKEIYIYNRKKLLKKVLIYNGEELVAYKKYKYKLH